MLGFGCANEFGKFVAGKSNQRSWLKESGEGQFKFTKLCISKSRRHRYGRIQQRPRWGPCVISYILYAQPFNLCRFRSSCDPLETEYLESGGAGHAENLNDPLILSPTWELVIDLPTTPNHVKLGMIRIDKIHIIYMQLLQHWPQSPRGISAPKLAANLPLSRRALWIVWEYRPEYIMQTSLVRPCCCLPLWSTVVQFRLMKARMSVTHGMMPYVS